MSNASDFVIENGVLTEYVGPGGDVTIPNNVTSIGTGGFRGCSSLKKVTIPTDLTSINWSVFKDSPNLTIHAPTGSYAEQFAKEKKIPFVTE